MFIALPPDILPLPIYLHFSQRSTKKEQGMSICSCINFLETIWHRFATTGYTSEGHTVGRMRQDAKLYGYPRYKFKNKFCERGYYVHM